MALKNKNGLEHRIAIVGAGLSGLSAGHQLMRAGLKPVIFERESSVGGRMSSEVVDGFIIDKGAYTFPEFYQNLRRFVGDLGMGSSLLQTPGTSSTFTSGKEYPIKIGSPMDFLGYKLLSLKNKKDMVKLFLYSASLGKSLSVAHPTQKTFELERETAADFLLQNYDEQILERIAYPIFSEIFLGSPENNSTLAFLSTLRNLTRFKIFALDHGMGSVPERIMRDLDVRLDSPVLKISPIDEDGPYEVHVGGAYGGFFEFDAVIMALPLPLVPKIVNNLPEELTEYFRNVVYAPSIVMAMAIDDEYENRSMINNLLRTDFSVLGTVVFDQLKGPRRVPQGKSLVTAILCEKAGRTLFHESDEKIAGEILKEMEILIPDLSKRIIFLKTYRWEHGALQLPPGHLWKRNSVRGFLEEGIHNLYFAGETLPISSLEASFNTGVRAANQLIEKNRRSSFTP
ncbi:MAG: NAD(P)/FAD-dependent oxidoreductase [Pseudomonadota bacterium]